MKDEGISKREIFSSDISFYMSLSPWGLIGLLVKYTYVQPLTGRVRRLEEGAELATKSVIYRGILGHFG